MTRLFAMLLTISLAGLCVAAASDAQTIRISEVMANPSHDQGGQRSGEFVELVNISDEPVDLTGWEIADGHATDKIRPFQDGGSMVLEPGMFAVILDPDNEGQYELPTDVTLLRPANAMIGNGLSLRDVLTLRDPFGVVMDTHTPPTSARHGRSYERIDLAAPDEPENWQHCTDNSGSTIGRPTSLPRPKVVDVPPQPDLATVVVLNEIMFRPKIDAPEWVEIMSLADVAITMLGWTISDSRQQPVDVPPGTIPARGFVILAANAADFRAEHPDTPQSALIVGVPLPSLDNSGDVLTLKAGGTVVLDTVTYASDAPDRGQSVERRDSEIDSERLDNWLLSTALSGSTPGAENSVLHQTGPAPLIQVQPNPFDPRTEEAEIRYEAPMKARVTLRVSDESGDVVRTILHDTPHAGRQTITWDGKDDANESVPDGVYTILLLSVVEGEPRAASVAVVARRP